MIIHEALTDAHFNTFVPLIVLYYTYSYYHWNIYVPVGVKDCHVLTPKNMQKTRKTSF